MANPATPPSLEWNPDRPWRDLAGILRPARTRLALGIAISILQCATALPGVWLVREIFDRDHPPGDGLSQPLTVGLLVGLSLLTAAFGIFGQFLIQQSVATAMARFRLGLLDRFYSLPKAAHDSGERTRLHDLAVHDTERVEWLLLSVTGQLLPNGTVALILVGALAFRSPTLFFTLIAILPVFYLFSRHSLRRFQQAAKETRTAFNHYSRGVTNGMRSLELAWFHGGRAVEIAGHGERIDRVRLGSIESNSRLVLHQRFQKLSYLAISVLVLILGKNAVDRGSISSGQLLSFCTLAALALNYVREAGQGIGNLVLGREPWLALHRFLHQIEPLPYTGHRQIEFSGSLEVRGVSFRYETPSREQTVLRNVAVQLQPGRIVALTGANGCGKSTLLHLLLGLYRPQEGQLLANGIPYDELDVADLRRQMGVVPQVPALISGSIRENIGYARPDATQEEIEETARVALADPFIRTLPNGYDTEVGEHGVLLSGGQHQRLALARALLGRPRLLILDEPTNHVDQEGVHQLLVRLRTLQPAPAILVITHAPAVLALSDEAWILADGQLTRSGPSA